VDRHGFTIKATYIVGEHNDSADRVSRLERAGDYQLNPEVFNSICNKLHFYPKVDLSASKQNHLLSNWGGLRAPVKDIEGSTYVGNAFNMEWKNFKPFLHPPIPLIFRTLKKFQREANQRALFVAPDWQGQYWSPLLKELTDRKVVIGPITEDLLMPGSRMRRRIKGDKGTLLPPGNLAIYILRVRKRKGSFHQSSNYQGDGPVDSDISRMQGEEIEDDSISVNTHPLFPTPTR
jgi:hypothetical protein